MKTWKAYQWHILIGIILIFAINMVITKDAFSTLSAVILGVGLAHFLGMVINGIFFKKQ
jgi:hypothetical protein